MRTDRLMVAALAVAAAGLAGAGLRAPRRAFAAPSTLRDPGVAYRIVFGASDAEPRDWSGSLVVAGGAQVRVAAWHFEAADKLLEDATWQCQTRLLGDRQRRPFEAHLPDRGLELVNRPGLLVHCSDAAAEVRVRTRAGEFSFRAADVPAGSRRGFLGAAERPGVLVQQVPFDDLLPAASGQDDYPAAAAAPDGTVWVAWQEYSSGSDRLLVQRLADGGWDEPTEVPSAHGDLFGSAAAVDGRGRLWVVWSARVRDNWDLYAARYDGRAWSAPERLTTDPGPDFFQRLVADRQGRLTLVWQGFRNGQSDILLRRLDGDRWSPELRVSESRANDWQPALAAYPDGRVLVAWDTYDRGNYDVVARIISAGARPEALGPVLAVGATPRFEAHASVAIDGSNRAWIAYDVGGQNWGKDTGFLLERAGKPQGTRLYETRAVEVQVNEGTGFHRVPSPGDLLPTTPYECSELPSLAIDAGGRVWVLMRHRTMKQPSLRGIGRGRVWEWYASAVSGHHWLPPAYLPDSLGRHDMRPAVAASRDGLLAVYATDQRPWANPEPGQHRIAVAALPPVPHAAAAALPTLPAPPMESQPPIHPDERQQVRRLREATYRVNGETYRLYRGDMHRHTDISSDGGGDGSLLDAYRYALDAAALDYLAITDHQAGNNNEYTWWRSQKHADLFHIPGVFTPLFAYERSLPFPNGHRNVVFAQRGVRTLPFNQAEIRAEMDSSYVLYPHLKSTGGIAMSHTSATGMGTDWRDNDPALEPLVEIFQGDRDSYEYAGAPNTAEAGRPATQEGGYRPAGFVWNAWAKGYRLGVQASSDHLSTHLSYACLIATAPTRDALLEAIRRRRAYAATDNIFLDVRLRDQEKDHLMGEDTSVRSRPRLRIEVAGTGPIQEVAIIRSNRIVYTSRPGGPRHEMEFTDMEARPGESYYYYVRIVQADGQMAWSSPVWAKWGAK
jgi:hypothetical protein